MDQESEKALSRSARRRRNKRLRQAAEKQGDGGAAVLLTQDDPMPVKIDFERVGQDRRRGELTIAADVLVGEYLKARHVPVLDAICGNLGLSRADFIGQVLRAAVIKELPGYREAMGAGGNSSKNIETLTERLPRKS